MIQRGTLIAVLIGVEVALVAMMAQAISPGTLSPSRDVAGDLRFPGGEAESKSDYSFATGPTPEVTVDISYADLTIYRRNEPGVTVNITHKGWHGFGSAPEIAARQAGDNVQVNVASDTWTWADFRRVTIAVSPGTRVTVESAGDIKATGLRAEASLSSVGNGSIVVEDFQGPSLHLETSNGRLTMHNVVTPKLDVSSSNGRVEATELRVRDGHIESSNGRVALGFASGADTTVNASTSNGNIHLFGFARTPASSVKRSSDDDDDDDDSAATKTVRVGAGTGTLDVETSNGSIDLTQEG